MVIEEVGGTNFHGFIFPWAREDEIFGCRYFGHFDLIHEFYFTQQLESGCWQPNKMQAEKLSQKTYRQAGYSGRFVGRKITVKLNYNEKYRQF